MCIGLVRRRRIVQGGPDATAVQESVIAEIAVSSDKCSDDLTRTVDAARGRDPTVGLGIGQRREHAVSVEESIFDVVEEIAANDLIASIYSIRICSAVVGQRIANGIICIGGHRRRSLSSPHHKRCFNGFPYSHD